MSRNNNFDPISCPNIAKKIKSGIQTLGVSSQIRIATIIGIEAWISNHQIIVNFLYLFRHRPKGILSTRVAITTYTMFIPVQI